MKGSQIISWLLILGLLVSVASQPVFASVTDVPSDHCAYQSVNSLVNRGFLATYEDGSFQGTNPVDRYTFAITIAKILDEIETGKVVGTQGDADLLKSLTQEFSNELVQFYADQEDIEEQLKQLPAIEERISNVVAEHVSLAEQVARLKTDLMMEALDTVHTLNNHEESIKELQDDVRLHTSQILQFENWRGEKDAVLAMIDYDLATLLDHQQEQIDQLKERKKELELDLQNVAVLRSNDEKEIASLQAEMEYLTTQVGISEEELAQLNRKISDEIAVQMNMALIRERGLSGNLVDLELEFERYQENAEKEIKSAKSTAIIAIAAAAVSIVLNFVK